MIKKAKVGKKAKRKTYHHGNLKETLIAAALKVIEKRGIEDLSLREVARIAKVSHAAPYRHFKDKNELLAAVAEEGFNGMVEEMKKACVKKNPLERLVELGKAYVRFATRHPSSFRVMHARELSEKSKYPSLYQAALQAFELNKQTVIECQKQGLIIDEDTHEITVAAWAICHGVAELINADQLPKPVHAEKLAEMVGRRLAQGVGKIVR